VSSIVTTNGLLHFEIVGRGEPLILLHGWINSWDVWRESMLALGTGIPGDPITTRRVYALDFWGFGASSKPDHSADKTYDLPSYVEMVREFMDNMGIASAPVAGHSLGGTVALLFALIYPNRTDKVIVVGSPIKGNSLNPFLKLAGYRWLARLVWLLPFIRSAIMRLLLAGDSEKVQEMISRDVQRTSVDSFFRSIGNLRKTDLSDELPNLSVPALGIFGAQDNIVSPINARLLAESARGIQLITMPNSRHFPMVDEPEFFIREISGFLNRNGQG
jgi:pimeloyl-ACP methyl ester carboxylesterase